MIRQIALMALAILGALMLIGVAFRLLTGLLHLIVLGVAIGVGAVLALILIYKVRQVWERVAGKKDLDQWNDK